MKIRRVTDDSAVSSPDILVPTFSASTDFDSETVRARARAFNIPDSSGAFDHVHTTLPSML